MYQTCLHCGKESRAIDRFCLHCGQRLTGEPGSGASAVVYVATSEHNAAWAISQPGEPVSQPLPAVGANGKSAAPAASAETPQPAAPPIIGWLAFRPSASTPAPAREYALDGGDVIIGRAPNCDIVLPDDQIVSRRHASLRYLTDHYVIADLGSSNGTYVNDVEVHGDTPLADRDRITLGEHQLIYTVATTSGSLGASGGAQTTGGFPIPVPPPWPPLLTGDTDVRLPTVKAARTAKPKAPPDRPETPAAEAAPEEPAALAGVTDIAAMPPSAPSARAATAASDIEALHTQLMEASAGLAHRVEAAEGELRQLRATLATLAQQSADALAAHALAASTGPTLDDVIQVVRQVSENPRHLDYITALAERAGDLLRLLEHEHCLASALGELQAQLTALAEEPQG